MTDEFVVGIPTLDRPRLLKLCVESILASTVLPKAICIVDNGRYVDRNWFGDTHGVEINIVTPPYNIGVAAAWNTIRRLYAPLDLVISNDDIILEPDTLATLRAAPPEKYLVFLKVHRSYGGYVFFLPTNRNLDWYAGGYSCFMIRDEMFKLIGEYDELLWPAYWEDTDFGKRCELAQVGPVIDCLEGRFKHGVSHADVKAVADVVKRDFVGALAEWNRRRLILKWGWPEQPPYINNFKIPYNGEKVDELELFLNKALIELKIYPECKALAEYLPLLKEYASKCKRIVEFGTGRGITTCGLLAGRPTRLLSYDRETRMEAYKLMGLRGGTRLEYRRLDETPTEVEPTDLLFVNATILPGQLERLLKVQSNVSTYLLVFGAADDQPAVDRLLGQHAEWVKTDLSIAGSDSRLFLLKRSPT